MSEKRPELPQDEIEILDEMGYLRSGPSILRKELSNNYVAHLFVDFLRVDANDPRAGGMLVGDTEETRRITVYNVVLIDKQSKSGSPVKNNTGEVFFETREEAEKAIDGLAKEYGAE